MKIVLAAATTNPYVPGATVLIGDAFPLARGYSVQRKLRGLYSGFAYTVRRSTDNVTLDVGFTGNNVNTAAVSSFLGSADGLIVTLYDQSGNGVHVTQATTTKQAKIATAGVVSTGGLVFDGVDDYYSASTAGLYALGATSVAAVVKGAAQAGGRIFMEGNSAAASGQYTLLGAGSSGDNSLAITSLQNEAGTSLIGPIKPGAFDNTVHQTMTIDTGSNMSVNVDQGAAVSAGYTRSGTLTPNRTAIGAMQRSAVSTYYAGGVFEILAFSIALSGTQATTVAQSQKVAYGTP